MVASNFQIPSPKSLAFYIKKMVHMWCKLRNALISLKFNSLMLTQVDVTWCRSALKGMFHTFRSYLQSSSIPLIVAGACATILALTT